MRRGAARGVSKSDGNRFAKNAQAEIVVHTPDGKLRIVALERSRYTVGRAPSNDLCYSNVPGLSPEHCALEQDVLMGSRSVLHYRLLEKIGAGGMGEVYKAQDGRFWARSMRLNFPRPDIK
jgi:hypothetical protein